LDSVDCTSCETGNYPLEDNSKKCKQGEVEEYFRDENLKKYMKCGENCNKCTSKEVCLKCNNNFFLHIDHTCYSKCPKKYYNNSLTGTCSECLKNCEDCINNNECLLCLENFYLYSQKDLYQCLDTCPDGYYKNESTRNCIICNYKCKLCRSETDCSSCEDKFIFFSLKNQCLFECPKGYYKKKNEKSNLTLKDSQNYCQNCKKGCLTCSSEEYCYNCEENYLSHKNKCLETCPDGFFPDYNNRECLQCHESCRTCKGNSVNDCGSCNNNLELKAGYCKEVEELPSNIVNNNENGFDNYFDIKECIDYITLSCAKLFFLETDPLIAEVIIKLKNNCENYLKDFKIEWDESILEYKHNFSNEKKNKIAIEPDSLKQGIFKIKVDVLFKNSQISSLKEETRIIINKVKIF